MILWDINTGEKTDVLYQPNGEAIRNCMFAPGNYETTKNLLLLH